MKQITGYIMTGLILLLLVYAVSTGIAYAAGGQAGFIFAPVARLYMKLNQVIDDHKIPVYSVGSGGKNGINGIREVPGSFMPKKISVSGRGVVSGAWYDVSTKMMYRSATTPTLKIYYNSNCSLIDGSCAGGEWIKLKDKNP